MSVQTTIGQVVDDESEGRDRGVLSSIQFDDDSVIACGIYEIGDLRAESSVACSVMGDMLPVEIDVRDMTRSIELQEISPGRVKVLIKLSAVADDLLREDECLAIVSVD